MTTDTTDHAREKGIALVYVGVFLVPLLLATGLAVDLGRGYLVRVTLAKAVDAAALAAARNLKGDKSLARSVANNIFNANFPAGFLGVTADQPDVSFDINPDGSNKITVKSSATLPTTFMRVAKFDSLRVSASAEATRRLVDMSFVIDRSGSLGGKFPDVKEAAKAFVGNFDPDSDRIALITFSSGTTVKDSMSPTHGFNLDSIKSHIDNASPAGPTATPEALYEAWDQLRSVPEDSRSGLRIIVLFTDGSPTAFPGDFPKVADSPADCTPNFSSPARHTVTGTITAIDYPSVPGNPSTTDAPFTFTMGLYDTRAESVTGVPPTIIDTKGNNPNAYRTNPTGEDKINNCIPYLPLQSTHPMPVSINMPGNIPTHFSIGPTLSNQRSVGAVTSAGFYEDNPRNTYNAARNLAETIADAIRREDISGSSKIRIYTLGLGDLLNASLGSPRQTGSDILRRIANDPASPDYDSTQLDGKFYFAGDPTDLAAAFNAVQDQIWRLSQ